MRGWEIDHGWASSRYQALTCFFFLPSKDKVRPNLLLGTSECCIYVQFVMKEQRFAGTNPAPSSSFCSQTPPLFFLCLPLSSLLMSRSIFLIAYQMDSYCIIKSSKPFPSPIQLCSWTFIQWYITMDYANQLVNSSSSVNWAH